MDGRFKPGLKQTSYFPAFAWRNDEDVGLYRVAPVMSLSKTGLLVGDECVTELE